MLEATNEGEIREHWKHLKEQPVYTVYIEQQGLTTYHAWFMDAEGTKISATRYMTADIMEWIENQMKGLEYKLVEVK